MTAGVTYYIVVDGWGSSAGDYEVEFTPYNPLAGYTILTADGPVGTAPRNATEWSTVLIAAEPTDLALSIRADYAIPGIFDIVSSDVIVNHSWIIIATAGRSFFWFIEATVVLFKWNF